MKITYLLAMGLGLAAGLSACRRDADEQAAPAVVVPLHLHLGSGTLVLN